MNSSGTRWLDRRRFLNCSIAGTGSLLLLGLTLHARPVMAEEEPLIRVGVIGLDTPHAAKFSQLLNSPKSPPELSGCRVVAACAQNSPDIAESLQFAPRVTQQIEELGIPIVETVNELIDQVDAVLLETNDGRMHLEQAAAVLKARKALFVDKPVAASLADVIAIYKLAEHYGTPIYSSSSLRYTDGVKAIQGGSAGRVVGCETFSPCPIEKTHVDLFWYGIHGVEPLITLMGTGCESVTRISTENTDVVVGRWRGGRIGTFRGRRKANNGYQGGYGGTVFGSKNVQQIGGFSGYEPLIVEIVTFFKTRKPPVSPRETIEIYAFMTAAEASKRGGSLPVRLEQVIRAAEEKATERIRQLASE